MLATMILDTYCWDERDGISAALDDICCPANGYGWSSSGLYFFWDTSSHELLYVGLAIDLPQRFKQHNGILGAPASSCKLHQITEYFQAHTRLGFTIQVQLSRIAIIDGP